MSNKDTTESNEQELRDKVLALDGVPIDKIYADDIVIMTTDRKIIALIESATKEAYKRGYVAGRLETPIDRHKARKAKSTTNSEDI